MQDLLTPTTARRDARPRKTADTQLNHESPHHVVRVPTTHSNSQIICTIGPKTNNVEMLKKLLMAGMNVARMNFSHGDHEFHQSIINNVRQASEESGITCAIMLDTKGPEIRTGKLKNGATVNLVAGNKFTFTTDTTILGDETITSTSYKRITKVVKPGSRILVGDGLIAFRVEEATETEVHCTILNSGVLGQVKGMNLPGCVVDLPAVTEKDKEDIAFGVKNDIDFIAASWIRKAADVEEIRSLPGVRETNIMIISKIESQEGLDNFQKILDVSDAIMVARGDLGVEIPIEKVAVAQKNMIHMCNVYGKPVITATQMLETMIQNPRPTRAEATDVANAVFDGTDCVMLSGETAAGNYPEECVSMMDKICIEAEKEIDYRNIYWRLRKHVINQGIISVSETIASSAVKSSWDLNSSLIIVLSDSGRTVRFVSKYRPHTPILCITSTKKTARQILLSRSAFALVVPEMKNSDNLIKLGVEWAKEKGFVSKGDYVVTTSGQLEGTSGSTNILRITEVL
eukprot:TRINITY_DN8646_c0_g1_i1.p1 TRINITY_DN8646_c0_g1~~TRINITY_DN8646_c0_g1_i1.p1  ORF type:complete len:516 (-),score=148.10 TRINITY_DN8646_c0_g1_i1:207-1754(-)